MTPASYWKQVREAEAKATPGPWEDRVGNVYTTTPNGDLSDNVADTYHGGDSEFIAIARTALPLALTRIEELEAVLERERPRKEHNDLCALDFNEGQCDCAFGTINRRIDAALGKP